MNKLQRVLCFLLALTLACCGMGFLTPPAAQAASTTHDLATLLANDQIKPLGRTQANADGTGIMTDWSGTGFEIRVNATGGIFTVKYKSSYDNYWQILLDGEYLWRGKAAKSLANAVDNGNYFSFHVPAGQHTVSIIKETQISSSDTAYAELQSLAFDGTILPRPADKDLYIEFVGDSYTCGDGSLGRYDPGVVWKTEEDSATNSYGYYTAQTLGADYSLVSRGGIGLFTGESAIEGSTNKVNMTQIYPYTAGYRTSSGEYSFARQPDVVVVWLGANDTIKASDAYKTMDYWMEKMEEFAALVHQKNPNADVVFLTHQNSTGTPRYNRLLALAEELNSTWTTGKAYAHQISLHGNGTPALANQTSGHPDDGDHAIIAKELVGFLRDNHIVSQTAPQQEPVWNDITYYVSASGSNSNPGTADAPLQTIPGAFTKALADKANGTYSDNDRIVFQVSGAVVGSSTQNFATYTIIKSASGSKVPVLVTTWNYDVATDNKAELKITNSYAADNAARLYVTNDITFQNVLLKSYMSSNGDFIVYQFNAAGHHVVFDNVEFSTETSKAWTVAADHFATGGVNVVTATTDIYSSVTFQNGDYTGLSRVAAVGGNNIFVSSGNSPVSVPKFHCALTIGEGAQMGTVYGSYGTLQPGSVTVTIEGGTVQRYEGTNSGASGSVKQYATTLNTIVSGGTVTDGFVGTGSYVTFTGNVSNTVSGGTISGGYMGAGNNVTITGDLSNTISGGKITSTPTAETECIFLGGGNPVTLNGNLTNEVSGGMLEIVCNNASIDHCIYFGCFNVNRITGNMTNKVSGGTFLMRQGTATPTKDWNLWFGHRSGGVTGTFRNEISGGLFDISNGGKGTYHFGSRTLDRVFGKIENFIGNPDNIGHGPSFVEGTVSLAGNHGDFGGSSASAVNDTVVISNTIYGGSFGSTVYCTNGSYHDNNIICGSVETTVYGGSFKGPFFGGGHAPVWGNITTSIYGGCFSHIYGGSNTAGAPTYGNVTLNLYALEELRDANSESYVIYAGSKNGDIDGALTLNLDPAKPGDLALDMPIYAKSFSGTVGSVSVNVNGGTFASGFAINGVTVKEALGSNAVLVNSSLQEVTCSDTDTSVSGSLVCYQKKASDEWIYYVSQDGDDRNSGRALDSAKQTIAGALNQAIADNGGRKTFADGVYLTVYVQGKVLNGHNAQMLGIGSILTNYNTSHMPITIAGIGADAVIDLNTDPVNGGSASFFFTNDITLRNVDLYSETNYSTTTGNYFCTNKLYAAGCQVELDNVTLYTDGCAANYATWNVYADHFSNGGVDVTALTAPVYSSITFKNGDYTNLANVSAVGCSSIWTSNGTYAEAPNLHCKIVVGEGAQMGTVTGSYGTLAVESIRVEFLGGTTQKYVGTGSGSSTSRKNYTADISVLVDGGIITGGYRGTGDHVNLTGSIRSTLASGQILATSTSAGNNIYFSAGNQATITGDVTNTISGGTVRVTNGGYDSEIVFGGRSSVVISGDLTNIISGGILALDTGAVEASGTHGIYLGNFTGDIQGTMTNTITGGTFEGTLSYPVHFGARGIDCDTGKIVNTLGSKETGEGPVFNNGSNIFLAGGWGRIGVSNHTALPTENRAETVVSNTIYGGTFYNNVYAGTSSAIYNGAVSGYIYGGIETVLYGGTFEKGFYGGCKHEQVYGSISTVIAPANTMDVVLMGTLYSGSAKDQVTLQVSGGHYPNGFTVSGKTIAEALAEGCSCWVDNALVTVSSTATTVAGDVTVSTVAATVDGVAFATFQEALTAAGNTGTIKLGQALEVQTLRIAPGITLDLNGKQVTAQDVLCFGDLIDSRNGVGSIVICQDPSLAVVHLQPGNSHLPIYDTANGCYRFYEYELKSLGCYTVSADAQKFGFRILLTNPSGYSLLAESTDPCLSLVVNLTVPSITGLDLTYTYTPELIQQYASNAALQTGVGGNVTTAFTLTVKGLSSLSSGETLSVTPRITTVSGMACQGSQASWTPDAG